MPASLSTTLAMKKEREGANRFDYCNPKGPLAPCLQAAPSYTRPFIHEAGLRCRSLLPLRCPFSSRSLSGVFKKECHLPFPPLS